MALFWCCTRVCRIGNAAYLINKRYYLSGEAIIQFIADIALSIEFLKWVLNA